MIELGLINYWMVVALLVTGLYVVMARQNLVKKILGLSIFQSAVIIFFVTLGKVRGGTAPIFTAEDLRHLADGEPLATVYSNPVPHVLMLTAIVVGIATVALALALVTRIYEAYGSIEERDILRREEQS
jgi:multicomponent Na+:H+ antiporter subunit C